MVPARGPPSRQSRLGSGRLEGCGDLAQLGLDPARVLGAQAQQMLLGGAERLERRIEVVIAPHPRGQRGARLDLGSPQQLVDRTCERKCISQSMGMRKKSRFSAYLIIIEIR